MLWNKVPNEDYTYCKHNLGQVGTKLYQYDIWNINAQKIYAMKTISLNCVVSSKVTEALGIFIWNRYLII